MDANRNSVLVVDNDTTDIRMLMDILNQDYTVYAERDSRKCLDAAKRLRPDLILLDVMMPEMNGFDVIRVLKGDSETKDIPAIFVTGLDSSDDEAMGFILGAADYINKPFSPPVVKMRVRNQLKIVSQMHEIRKLSLTDSLTGVGNRPFFNKMLEQDWERARRQQTSIGFMLLDVDNFKAFNDKYGHTAGDTALQSVAHAISSELSRATDKVARWNGEEFAIILPDTTMPGLRKVAESIRNAIEKSVFTTNNENHVSITACVGIHCAVPERTGDYTINDLIFDTDKALCHAKSAGENRVFAKEDF